MLSMKAKYGLRALLYLARQENQGPVLISELAEKESIPKKFLELILLDLKNHGILQSKKGKGGGYSLSRRPEAIKLGRVIRVLDGPLAPLPCASQTAYVPCDGCEDENTCGHQRHMVAIAQEARGRDDTGDHSERTGPVQASQTTMGRSAAVKLTRR